MSEAPGWVRQKAAATIHPGQVERTLTRLVDRWPGASADELRQLIEQFPLGENALLHLLAVSSICATRLTLDPEILNWVAHRDVCAAARGRRRMLADLRGGLAAAESISAHNFRPLRLWKGREMLRIALREVADVASLEETTAELSQVAEICLTEVLAHWDKELRQRLGSPKAELAVLAMGKLGGRELNHSSDIDVIFLYSEEGQISASLTYHQWFNRLAAKVFETFAVTDSSGSLFRMDVRLRPEGTAGPMARSLESMENYYAGFGETWERLALTKARVIAGSEELAYDFLREHQPFIYPRSPTPELLDEIAAIKRRIERDIVGHENLDRNVKLGIGGIREVEFIVQALQLLHGARQPFLQETSTLKTLPDLAELGLLPQEDALALNRAYRFLRRVEHRLQIESEQQTHTVPEGAEPLRRLALSLGFRSSAEFSDTLHEQMRQVRSVFMRVIASQPQDTKPAASRFDIFRDRAVATKLAAELGHGRGSFHVAPRTRQVFRKLEPQLLEQLASAADPDATLVQFTRFVEAYGMRSMLFELLVANPRLLELLVKTFDASRHASDVLIRRPQLLEDVTRGSLDRNVSVARHLVAMRKLGVTAGKLDALRTYRQAQFLRILIRDVLKLANHAALLAEHSALAEACLIFMHGLVASDGGLTVVAMGKFGGAELTYGADLDVMFVGENTRAAQTLVVEMGRTTAEGNIFLLDARLRPDGEKGTLTCAVEAFESYYWTRAQLWEIQSLTRARTICGPDGAAFIDVAQRAWRIAGQRDDLLVQIDAMRERIRRDRGTGSEILDYKTGLGGIVEAEFLIQALQMRTGVWQPQFSAALGELKFHGTVTDADADAIQNSYDFLRHCESVLRRWESKSVSSLPADEAEQRKLAKRVGAKDLDAFGEQYRAAREIIHAAYERYMRQP